MNSHVSILTETFLEPAFYGIGMVMGTGQRDVSVHEYMQLNGVEVTDTAGTQVMGFYDIGFRLGYLHDLILDVIGQGVLQKVSHTLDDKLHGHLDNECADYYRCQRIKYGPAFSKQNGTANTYGCSYG